MRIIHSKIFPPIYLINLFGVLFAKDRILMLRYAQFLYIDPYAEGGFQEARYAWDKLKKTQEVLRMIIGKETLNEERIHTEQMKWLGYIPYYILYLIFFLLYYVVTGFSFQKGYELNPFEKEAKANRKYSLYLQMRGKFGWVKYF